MIDRLRNVSFLILIAVLVVGCTTAPRSEFTIFAQAGAGYAVAVDKLLLAAGTAQIDSTSWSLVIEKQSTGMDDDTYLERTSEDLSRLETIGHLRRQARLLGQYFGLLEALATSDSPERTKTTIGGVVSELKKLEPQMPPLGQALPDIGKVVVEFRIRAALRRELEDRKEVIRSHLALQEELLKELAGQIKHALELSRQNREQVLVMDPLVSKNVLEGPERWVSARREILLASVVVDEVDNTSCAAKKLRESFEALISGETTIGRLNALMTDIEGLLSIAESIRSEGE